jgi:hypothetical protein
MDKTLLLGNNKAMGIISAHKADDAARKPQELVHVTWHCLQTDDENETSRINNG